MSFSVLSEKCSKCPKRLDCDHKKMEAVAEFKPTMNPLMQPLMQPLLNKSVENENTIMVIPIDKILNVISEKLKLGGIEHERKQY